MHQDKAKNESRGNNTIPQEEDWDGSEEQNNDEEIKDSDGCQVKAEITTTLAWSNSSANSENINDTDPLVKTVSDQQESHDRESSVYKGRESNLEENPDQSHPDSPTSIRRQSPSKELRESRNTMPSAKGRDKTTDGSLESDGYMKPTGASSRPTIKSSGRSKSYDPQNKERYTNKTNQEPDNQDGRRQDKHPRQGLVESQEGSVAESAHTFDRAAATASSTKHKDAPIQTSKRPEQREREKKQQHVEWMRHDPSAVYDSFLKHITKLSEQSEGWEARVSLLTEEMLAGRDRFQPATDGDLKGKMNTLRQNVKDLVREMNPRQIPEKTFVGTVEGKQLAVATAARIGATKLRTPILQSSIWCLLVRYVFAHPFVVFGREGAQANVTWRILYGGESSEHDSTRTPRAQNKHADEEEDEGYPATPEPEESCERWKSMTAMRLKDKAGGSSRMGSDAKRALQKMLDALSDSSNQPSEEPSWLSHLRIVLRSAVELAVVMGQQRSRLELFVPDLRKISVSKDHCCDGKTVDFDEGQEGPLGGKPVLVVTPGLRKWGDGLGGKLASYIDLEAAYVKCI